MNISMTDEMVVEAFRASVLKSMTPELQAGIIGRAVEEILKKDITTRHGTQRNWLVESAMQAAVQGAVQATFAEFFARGENRAKLREAALNVADAIVAKTGDTFAEKAAVAFMDALASEYACRR